MVSLYVSVVAMFGGVGSIAPANFFEYGIYTMMMLFGSMVWAWVIGSLCGILSTLNPNKTAYQNMMDELEFFMRERNFANPHRVRLREFFRQTQEFSRLASCAHCSLLLMHGQRRRLPSPFHALLCGSRAFSH